jgi:hypothetical protein
VVEAAPHKKEAWFFLSRVWWVSLSFVVVLVCCFFWVRGYCLEVSVHVELVMVLVSGQGYAGFGVLAHSFLKKIRFSL